MKKETAIRMLGGPKRKVREVAKALDVSPQYVYNWPDELSQPLSDRCVGAAVRLGLKVLYDSRTRSRSTVEPVEPK